MNEVCSGARRNERIAGADLRREPLALRRVDVAVALRAVALAFGADFETVARVVVVRALALRVAGFFAAVVVFFVAGFFAAGFRVVAIVDAL